MKSRFSFTLFLCFLLLLILCSCEKKTTAGSLSPQSDAVTEKVKGLQEITTFSEGDIYLTPSSLTLSDLFLQGTDVCCLLAKTECDVFVARFYSESVSLKKTVGATVQNCYVQLYHFQTDDLNRLLQGKSCEVQSAHQHTVNRTDFNILTERFHYARDNSALFTEAGEATPSENDVYLFWEQQQNPIGFYLSELSTDYRAEGLKDAGIYALMSAMLQDREDPHTHFPSN